MSSKRSSLSVSVRRHFIDEFFFSKAELLRDKKIVDIGGKKKNKRGLFDLGRYSTQVTYVNIDKSTEPDILSTAEAVPLPENSFDVAIMGELLEHVPSPLAVLKEARRLLRPGGIALVTIPFMAGVHGDPHDYGRYTPAFLEKISQEAGFKEINIERHGAMFAVLALMLQHLFLSQGVSWRPIQNPLVSFLMWLDKRTESKALTAWTTGYGIILKK